MGLGRTDERMEEGGVSQRDPRNVRMLVPVLRFPLRVCARPCNMIDLL